MVRNSKVVDDLSEQHQKSLFKITLCLAYIPLLPDYNDSKAHCLWLSDLGDSKTVLKEYILAHLTRYSSIVLLVSLIFFKGNKRNMILKFRSLKITPSIVYE